MALGRLPDQTGKAARSTRQSRAAGTQSVLWQRAMDGPQVMIRHAIEYAALVATMAAVLALVVTFNLPIPH